MPSSTNRLAANYPASSEPLPPGISGLDEQPQTPAMARLVIEDPRLSDEALYKCDVTYVKGKCPSISLVKLQMMALPNKAQITHLQRNSQVPLAEGQLVGTYSEREQLQLGCLVYGGRPQPKSVIWRKIDAHGRTVNLMSARYSTKAGKDFTSNLLEVDLNHTLTSDDLGAKFECHVEHEALEQGAQVRQVELPGTQASPPPDTLLDLHPARSASADVQQGAAAGQDQLSRSKSLDSHVLIDLNVGVASVDLFLAKVNRRNSSEPLELKEGDLVELECVAYNSKPPANITWFNGVEPIEQLLVSDSLPTTSTSNSNSDNLSLKKQPSRHKRLLQRNQVHQNADGHTYDTHSYLSIRLSRHEHRAQIQCKAQNSLVSRQPFVKTLELQVQHAPIVLMEPASGAQVNEYEEGGAEGDEVPVSIYCIYSANPSELILNSTRWFKDSKPLPVSALAHLSESLTATGYPVLSIQRVSRTDAGSYECQLANALGLSERLPASEHSKLEVNFRPSVRLRISRAPSQMDATAAAEPLLSLTELEPAQELIQAGNEFMLSCDVLEARPAKIQAFHWFKKATSSRTGPIGPGTGAMGNTGDQPDDRLLMSEVELIAITESARFRIHSLAANFTPSSFACAALNSLGSSKRSNQIDLQLSYNPGPSFVHPVIDPTQRKTILTSGSAHLPPVIDSDPRLHILHQQQQQPLAAGRELLLECITSDLGRPRTNLWLWFKDGQPIDSSSSSWPIGNQLSSSNSITKNLSAQGDKESISKEANPITGQESTAPFTSTLSDSEDSKNPNRRREESSSYLREIQRGFEYNAASKQPSNIKLISSGRYLFISSIRLSHTGNYSCVAVNRLGSGLQQSSTLERDSYRLKVALAPSFIQPLVPRSYWPEVQIEGQLELVCHVQCEPICQLEWLKNNELMDLKSNALGPSESSKYVTYQESHMILDENSEANQFKSIRSKLVLQFHGVLGSSGDHKRSGGRATNEASGGALQKSQDRARALERRALLSGVNYTCQSSPNFMGPSVKSTTRFIVQYPPENVLISSPSDKLSLVEGSNGPRLSCGASGEPQVQFRWFLLKNTASDLSIPNRTPRSMYESSRRSASSILALISHSPSSSADGDDRNTPTANQVVSKAFDDSIWEASKGLNDSSSENMDRNLIELTRSATELVGGLQHSNSNLDLSNLSLDRRQAGYYVCEASNRLGQTRQSVYVDVLYKPTCTTLHLHSLDLIMPISLEKFMRATREDDFNVISIKPFIATNNDEYTVVHETNEDFIQLRKILVLSPLIRKYSTLMNSGEDSLTFKGSIFDTIFKAKGGNHIREYDSKYNQLKSTETLIHSDDKANEWTQPESSAHDNSIDSWDRFNLLLLRLLNGYMKRIKVHEEQVTLMSDTLINKEKLQNRRSLSGSFQTPTREEFSSDSGTDSAKAGIKNLLTFACMARDANPISNLTFDWSFGSITMPETTESPSNVEPSISFSSNGSKPSMKPLLVYVNSNYTVQITLVHRLDTRSMLSPFQLSLVTLNAMINPGLGNFVNTGTTSTDTQRLVRQATTERATGQRIAVNKQRYQSDRNGLKANINNDNTHSEIDISRPYDILPTTELDEHNWQEQIGGLLKCKVTNQIGTSDACHVRVNIAERLKSQSSPSEFAKWKMPSLASKSLLIISILIGCTLIIFVTFALLAGPYIRELSLRKEINRGSSNREDNKTAQSMGCQKSSVLGLLGNGDTSTQGSSDDDVSAKANHHSEIRNSRVQNSFQASGNRLSLNLSSSTDYRQKRQMMQECSTAYDKPRNVGQDRLVYQCGKFIDSIPKNFHPQNDESIGSISSTSRAPESLVAVAERGYSESSTAKRLLANLRFKSLTKFKVDKISDLSDFATRVELMRNLHTKNISSSETNTTGLSISALDSEHLSSPISSASPTFFEPPSVRTKQTSFKGSTSMLHPNQLDATQYIYSSSSPRRNQPSNLRQINSQRMIQNISSTTVGPAYSNIMIQEPMNAMDEFIRQREVDNPLEQDSTTAFYRSQSVRKQITDQMMYPAKIDLNQHCPSMMNENQSEHYHTHQASTLYNSRPIHESRPITSARLAHKPMLISNYSPQLYQQTLNSNRLSMPVYNQTFSQHDGVQMATLGYMDTIDSHLNRLADSMATGFYPIQNQQTAYVNTLNKNPYNLNLCQDGDPKLSSEHIYDVNAYATPEQTPLRRPNSVAQPTQFTLTERPRVSQLIQTFNSKAPE